MPLVKSTFQKFVNFLKQNPLNSLILVLITLSLTSVVLVAVPQLLKNQSSSNKNVGQKEATPATQKTNKVATASGTISSSVQWNSGPGGILVPTGTPPPCPEQPIFTTPVDLSLATSILYPGQVRGNAFKPHGGFRFDKQPNNDITLTVPMDAKLIRGSKGLFTENGEVQYGFEFIAPCGIWYSFGHIHTLSSQFQAYADNLPLISDHATQQLYNIDSTPEVKKGDVIATQVGIIKTKNVFVEWAVLDYRHKNGFTIRPEWAKYADEFDEYAVCWLDMIPAVDSVKAKSLPGGDSVSGKKSDYCK